MLESSTSSNKFQKIHWYFQKMKTSEIPPKTINSYSHKYEKES